MTAGLVLADIFSDGGKDIAMSQPTPIWKLQRQIAHAALRSDCALRSECSSCIKVRLYMLHLSDCKTLVPRLLLNAGSTLLERS